MLAEDVQPAIVVTHEQGVRFAAEVRGHRVVIDQPVPKGGGNAGVSPIELLGVSLAGCVAFYVQQFCQARGLSYSGMRVEVAQESVRNPSRIARFAVRIVLPSELPQPYPEMIEAIARICPAHNTLVSGAAVSVEIGPG